MEGILFWMEAHSVLGECLMWAAIFTLGPMILKGLGESLKWIWRGFWNVY